MGFKTTQNFNADFETVKKSAKKMLTNILKFIIWYLFAGDRLWKSL